MQSPRLLQTATFRLAAVYSLLFAASVAVLGLIVYFATSTAMQRRLDAGIESEMATLLSTYRSGGTDRLVAAIDARERSRAASPFDYLLLTPDGARLAGRLVTTPKRMGWSDFIYEEGDGDLSQQRFLAKPLSNGDTLAIAANFDQVAEVKDAILNGFLSAFGAVLLLGIVGGVALSFAFLKRVEAIRRTSEAIIAGDLTQRVPVRGTNDDLDRLSQTLNRMLDRIAELMESLRQVSADIAHDLKTPLARLRHRLEVIQAQTPRAGAQGDAVDAAIAGVDEILAIFGALLRIAQIESGTRRAGFRDLDLSSVFVDVVEAFSPAAEDGGKRLDAKVKAGIAFMGDRELLTQMLANLIENAILHTPAGRHIEVSLGSDRDRIVATVTDNGPGIPPEQRERIFQRFVRLERSRSTPGSGLGLSVVKAVADLHAIALEVRDAKPGLQIILRFPEGRHPPVSADGAA